MSRPKRFDLKPRITIGKKGTNAFFNRTLCEKYKLYRFTKAVLLCDEPSLTVMVRFLEEGVKEAGALTLTRAQTGGLSLSVVGILQKHNVKALPVNICYAWEEEYKTMRFSLQTDAAKKEACKNQEKNFTRYSKYEHHKKPRDGNRLIDAMVGVVEEVSEHGSFLREKPPLGAKPEIFHEEERLRELAGAIDRYVQAGRFSGKDAVTVSVWCDELSRRLKTFR